ncbi:MAG: helix-hairpin-helix domain-containing protein [Desulfarculus sp.]|nr:MAG: helix-hairpin-helix domain-containing protein [Desulfarculus sp.]
MKATKRFAALSLALMLAVSFAGLALAADKPAAPAVKAADPKAAKPAVQPVAKPAAAKTININTAGVKELKQLKGVGDKLAKAIVDYRAKKGAFKAPQDIMKIKGIGKKTFEANKAIIVVK